MADAVQNHIVQPFPWRSDLPPRALYRAKTAKERLDLNRLVDRGDMERLDRGLFLATRADVPAYYEFAAVSLRLPEAIICLGSALAYHQLTTSGSPRTWIGLRRGQHAPRWAWPQLEIAYLPDDQEGIEVVTIDQVPVRITSRERTVAECWRFEDRVGTDLCFEATREALRNKASQGQLFSFSKRFGVEEKLRLVLGAVIP